VNDRRLNNVNPIPAASVTQSPSRQAQRQLARLRNGQPKCRRVDSIASVTILASTEFKSVRNESRDAGITSGAGETCYRVIG